MTKSFIHILGIGLMLTVIGCGKNSDKSSSAPNQPVFTNNLSTSGAQAQTNLLAWYNSSSEGGFPSLVTPLKQVTISTRTFSTSNNCNSQPISVFGINLGNINLCYNNSTSGSATNTSSYVSLSSSTIKSNNVKLSQAMNGIINPTTSGMQLVSITQNPSTKSAGSIFTIQYFVSGKYVVYTIDTGMNSGINPIYHMDGVNGKEETLVNVYPL